MKIESLSNPLIKQIKKLKDKKNRKAEGLYLIEGVNLALEFLTYSKDLVKNVIATEDKLGLVPDEFDVTVVSQRVFESVSDTCSPQGLMVVGKIPDNTCTFENMSLVVYLDRVADPGNVGTIIRTADALGVDAVVLSKDCTDLYNSKTVRSTMGSMFHIPVLCEENYLDILKELKNKGFKLITGSLDGDKTLDKLDFAGGKTVICLGNEAHGVSKELVDLGVVKTKIYMPGKAESLNVAVAGAIFMYEATLKRGNS